MVRQRFFRTQAAVAVKKIEIGKPFTAKDVSELCGPKGPTARECAKYIMCMDNVESLGFEMIEEKGPIRVWHRVK